MPEPIIGTLYGSFVVVNDLIYFEFCMWYIYYITNEEENADKRRHSGGGEGGGEVMDTQYWGWVVSWPTFQT